MVSATSTGARYMSMIARRATRAEMPDCAAVINDWIDGTDWFPRIFDAETIVGMFE